MKYAIAILSILVIVLFVSKNKSCNKKMQALALKRNPVIINLQPFKGISQAETNYVYTELTKYYSTVQLKEAIDLPSFAFYPARNRYRADSLIHYLSKSTLDGYVTIGITNKDISTNKDAIKDWGVMGLGYCPGKSCIASSFRLSKTEKQIQLFKVAIHEFGHTQGLPHCEVKSCFMRDAEGRNPTNEETEFCSYCKSALANKNFIF
jgi:archaemetzincin